VDNPGHSDTISVTYFAPTARASDASLKMSLEAVSRNDVINILLKVVNGLLAVLNEQRQILIVNDLLLQYLGITNTGAALGLRPGEALNCIHAHDEPGGCGTSKACQTCGAVIAMVACMAANEVVQSKCFITVEKNGLPQDFYFQVDCNPIFIDHQRYLLLFLRDTTSNQRRAVLERSFFHDMNNIVGTLSTTCELLNRESDPLKIKKMAERMRLISSRILKELAIQRTLAGATSPEYDVVKQKISLRQLMTELRDILLSHEACQNKKLNNTLPEHDIILETDPILLERILINMLINAFEATEEGGEVRFWMEATADAVIFCVWNNQAIPESWIPRIFQRNFSTKTGTGRGTGTYIMKHFGECYLGGTVNFTTDPASGTTFTLQLPKRKT
jgi:K+-sensing histidine kinase KdpD